MPLLHPISLDILCFHFCLKLLFYLPFNFFFDIFVVRECCFISIIHEFSSLLLLLISSFIPLWLEKTLGMISVFLNLLRLILWRNIWSIWNMFHAYLRRICLLLIDVLYLAVMSILSMLLFKCTVSLMIFCPDDLYIV